MNRQVEITPHISHSVLTVQDYLKPKSSSVEESKFTFLVRSRMLDVRNSDKGHTHSVARRRIVPVRCTDSLVTKLPRYEQLFGSDLEDL